MIKLSSLKIGFRLSLGFAAVLLTLASIATYETVGIEGLNASFDLYGRRSVNAIGAADIQNALLSLRSTIRQLAIVNTLENKRSVEASLTALADGLSKQQELTIEPARRAEWQKVKGQVTQDLRDTLTGANGLFVNQDSAEAARGEVAEASSRMATTVAGMLQHSEEFGDLTAISVIQDRVLTARMLIRSFQFTGSADEISDAQVALRDAERKFDQFGRMGAAISKNPLVLSGRANLDAMFDGVKKIREAVSRRTTAIEANNAIIADISKNVSELRNNTQAAMDETRAATMSATSDASRNSMIASFLAIVFGAVMAFLIARSITRPIKSLTSVMGRLADGELSTEIPSLGRGDEIGAMAATVQYFRSGLIRNKELEASASNERGAIEQRRKEILGELATNFESAVGDIVNSVAASARDLESAAKVMSQGASETSDRSTAVASAAQETWSNVNVVASSAEELGSSVQEISRQVQQSAAMSQAAVKEAAGAASVIGELSQAAGRINDVLNLISTIAGQTNLLALNATIEAARAGEAGRGFAVVASEVKELANQTARATAEISDQIAAIQSSTARAVGTIDSIGGTIDAMSKVAVAISGAVEEQGAATAEIVRSIAQASAGTGRMTNNIAGVAQAVQDSGASASQVLSASGQLARQAEQLRNEVVRVLNTIRAA